MTPEEQAKLAFASRAVYYAPEAATQSLNAPIYMSSSFQYDADSYQRVVEGERKAVNIYGRCGNPSEYLFEEQMMVIEGADACLATASGMAAMRSASLSSERGRVMQPILQQVGSRAKGALGLRRRPRPGPDPRSGPRRRGA